MQVLGEHPSDRKGGTTDTFQMPFQAENGSRPRFHLLDNAEIGTETYGRFTVYERAHAVHILQRVAMDVLDEKSRRH